jgi:hypothetical protein
MPVFVFGSADSGLSSLAMALMMLGYRCCSDLIDLPCSERDKLFAGDNGRIFNAYVNILSLAENVVALNKRFPDAKFFITTRDIGDVNEEATELLNHLDGADVEVLPSTATNKWKIICEHLRCAPPTCPFPEMLEHGQRELVLTKPRAERLSNVATPKHDKSPWVVQPCRWWHGIHLVPSEGVAPIMTASDRFTEKFNSLDTNRWFLRDDTFTGNLALFRPSNIELSSGQGIALCIKKATQCVREYTSASLTSRDQYLFGRFEATIKASNVPGVVTGFFLHRDSPRQEIDVEIIGNRPDRLLVNVFYNPGGEGVQFDYGYRGTPSYVDLGFDASDAYHRFAIEWDPCEIRWFVDNRLVHKRVEWDPTPIPHLPMALHVNTWPSRSKELAGRLDKRRLPTASYVQGVALEAHSCKAVSL